MIAAWVRPSEFLAALATVLRAARRDAGMTLRAVRQATEGYFRPSAVNGYERAQRQISIDRLCHLAEVYGTTGDELLRRTLAALGQAPPKAPPASRDRADTLRLFYGRVLGEGDLSLIDEVCDPDFIDHEVPVKLRLARTAAGFRSWMEMLHATFSTVSVEIEDLLVVGEQAVVRLQMTLTYPSGDGGGSGRMRRLEVRATEWLRFVGDRLAERWGVDGGWLLEQARRGSSARWGYGGTA